MARESRYKAFISYSHRDRKWASWLHHQIESYRTPKHLAGTRTPYGQVPTRLVPVFRDRDELASAHDLSGQIERALAASENLIVICSPDAHASRYVNAEIEAFCRLGRSDRVFSLIVSGDPTAQDTDRDCFPPALRRRYDADGHILPGEIEPIAADVRPEGDGRALARLKILAGLLGVGLDDLRQRELQRRLRRSLAIAATASIALLVTIVLAIGAHLARKEAEQRRAQAEDLLSFMVVDLRESLEPLGRLDLLEKIGGQAMDYFATVKLGDLTDRELARHAQVITQIGEIRVNQRQYDESLRAFSEAYERSAALARNDPGDGDRLYTRAQAEFWVGYVHSRRGDLDEARIWLRRYLDSSRTLAALNPDRADWAIEVAYGHHNLAVLAFDAEDLDTARAEFEDVIDALEEIAARDEGADLRWDVADAESWLGNIAFASGDLAGARRHYAASAAIYEEMSADRPADRRLRYSWSHATHFIVLVDSALGERARAASLAEDVMRTFDELTEHDPTNLEWLRSSAKPRIARANLHLAAGELASARGLLEPAVKILEGLTGADRTDVSVHESLADAYVALAWLEYETADASGARQAITRSLANLHALELEGPLSRDLRGRVASALVLAGEIEALVGEAAAARNSWLRALEVLGGPQHDPLQSPWTLDPLVRALALSGSTEETREARTRAAAMGYRPLRPWPKAAAGRVAAAGG